MDLMNLKKKKQELEMVSATDLEDEKEVKKEKKVEVKGIPVLDVGKRIEYKKGELKLFKDKWYKEPASKDQICVLYKDSNDWFWVRNYKVLNELGEVGGTRKKILLSENLYDNQGS